MTVGRVWRIVAVAVVTACSGIVLYPRSIPVAGASEHLTVVLVRHAETPSAQSGDPGLSPIGRGRADDLTRALRDRKVGAILVSPLRRTQETARPLAGALGLRPVIVPLTTIEAHVQELAAQVHRHQVHRHQGETILVVGHSNTVPALIAVLGGPKLPDLCEGTFDRLFVLTIRAGHASLTRSRYGDPSPGTASDCP